jgi:hypothetical protein
MTVQPPLLTVLIGGDEGAQSTTGGRRWLLSQPGPCCECSAPKQSRGSVIIIDGDRMEFPECLRCWLKRRRDGLKTVSPLPGPLAVVNPAGAA